MLDRRFLGPDGPVSVQIWDWHDLLANDWLVWTIEHDDGHRTMTVTEFGIIGKIGANSRGFGTHINLLHHESDRGTIGVPVHVLVRTILDEASDLGSVLAIAGSASVSASSALTLVGSADGASSALSAELCPLGPRIVLPSAGGLLLHTNQFLDLHSAGGDLGPATRPDSLLRLDILNRALTGRPSLTRDKIVGTMTSHLGLGGAVCCHPEDDAEIGSHWATLATVSLDVGKGNLYAREGGPCHSSASWCEPLTAAH